MSADLGILFLLLAAGISLSPQSFRRTEHVVNVVERMLPRLRPRRRNLRHPTLRTEHLLGKLDGALAHDGSATMSVWAPTAGTADSEADTTKNITVYAWIIPAAQEIVSGARVHATLVGGQWYVTGSDTCPTLE